MMRKWILRGFFVLVAFYVLFIAGTAVLALFRPPQPLELGTYQWLGEAGVTVNSVDRVATITAGKRSVRAHGIFYIVHAVISAPFGLRPTWHDSDVDVETFAGSGHTTNGGTYNVDEAAQTLEDVKTGRPGPDHEVRGATQHEDLVFDLPLDVEQPGFIVKPANDPMGLVGAVFGEFWQPHRFNLRYD